MASGANALFALFKRRGGLVCRGSVCFSAAFKLFVYLLELQLHHLIRHNVDPTAGTELQRLRTDQIQPERKLPSLLLDCLSPVLRAVFACMLPGRSVIVPRVLDSSWLVERSTSGCTVRSEVSSLVPLVEKDAEPRWLVDASLTGECVFIS